MNLRHQRAGLNNLLSMTLLHFLSMYILMYAMVDTLNNVYPNFNQFYMAMIMTSPMVILELFFMRHMYESRSVKILTFISTGIFVAFFFMIRLQTGINDREFLKSMIPHHAGALLMCEKAKVSDPRIKLLCQEILRSQQKEIDEMKDILSTLED